jgi:hypothetical protein
VDAGEDGAEWAAGGDSLNAVAELVVNTAEAAEAWRLTELASAALP